MPEPSLSSILWANVGMLMQQPDPSINAVAQRTSVGRGNIQRIRDGENVTLATLDALARAFRVPPWRLLVPPGLAVAEPPAPFEVKSDAQLVEHLAELVERLPDETRAAIADVVAGWMRVNDDGDRKAAVMALMRLRSKQQRAA